MGYSINQVWPVLVGFIGYFIVRSVLRSLVKDKNCSRDQRKLILKVFNVITLGVIFPVLVFVFFTQVTFDQGERNDLGSEDTKKKSIEYVPLTEEDIITDSELYQNAKVQKRFLEIEAAKKKAREEFNLYLKDEEK